MDVLQHLAEIAHIVPMITSWTFQEMTGSVSATPSATTPLSLGIDVAQQFVDHGQRRVVAGQERESAAKYRKWP
jgi:hypothetical protein